MSRPRTFDELVEAFRALGVPEPEAWATSEVNEGINQLGRATFLALAWKEIVSERDHSWIDGYLQEDVALEYGVGASLRRILDAGIDRADLAYVARVLQHDLLFGLCLLIDGQPEGSPTYFGLFEVDLVTGEPIAPINGLHESTLETDPEGLELGSIRNVAL